MDIEKQKEVEIKEWQVLSLRLAKLLLAKIQDMTLPKEKRDFYRSQLLELKPKLKIIIDCIKKI